MDLEKPYLRLTTFPRKESVRPMPVLQRALVHIQQRYLQTEDFDWCNEQLKSLRQDLTVQSSCWRRRSNQSHSYDTHSNSNKYDRFVLNVYETHARILLEHGDLAEFNQCQTNLAQLTNGNNNPGYGFQQSEESTAEFRAYAILYSLVREAPTDLILHLQHSFPSARKNNNREKPGKASTKRRRSHVIGSATAIATPAVAISACVDHAWQVVRAVTTNSYRTFFRLYDSAPHLSAYLMDFLVQRVRQAAYDCIVAAYRPSVSVEFVRQHLQLADGEETRHFLQQRRAVFLEQPPSSSDHHQHQKQEHEPPLLLFWIDCKASQKLLQS